MDELNKFYQTVMQDVVAMQSGDEDGDTENRFSRVFVKKCCRRRVNKRLYLAYDERDFGKKGQHKINGYSLSENYENVDLFITLFNNSSEIKSIPKADIDTAVKRITNFFRKAVYNSYAEEVAESSEIFEFAHTLATYSELKENLIRVNAFILTNGEYKGEIPPSQTISGYSIFY